jgi:CubicO group peptidase (beta-lactamase class C family)
VRAWTAAALTIGLALAATAPAATAGTNDQPADTDSASETLADGLLQAVRTVDFSKVIDYGPEGRGCPGRGCPYPVPRRRDTPSVDVAVIELDGRGQALAAANVLVSRDYPRGVSVPISSDWGTRAVRFRGWGTSRDLVSGRSDAQYTFTAPYPASLFKVMVAYQVMRLVDAGRLKLDGAVAYRPTVIRGGCGGAGSARLRSWLDSMITVSSNRATCVLLKLLHDMGQIDALNRELRAIGLGTLQLNGTLAANGGQWLPGRITMTALDTARLMWLMDGGADVLWRTPDGIDVRADRLSGRSRRVLRQMLIDDAWANTLSSVLFCGQRRFGRPYPAPGIPHALSRRWINPRNGYAQPEGNSYGSDVRPCNRSAEVSFAHKIGLTWTFASDAGVVRSLPGDQSRRYAIAILTDVGERYADPEWARVRGFPCQIARVCRSERFAQLGKLVDDMIKERAAAREKRMLRQARRARAR